MDSIVNAKKSALIGENPDKAIAVKEGPRRRTGGRSARVLDAVADAVLKELAESGIENFSIPAVAVRAGVSSSSIYRRWPSKAALIAFSSGRVAQEGIPFPDRGSLRNDLLRVLVEVWDFLRDPKSRGLIALSFSVSDSAELQDAQRSFWNLRVEQQKVMFDRAVARGEIHESTDIGDVIERVVGPLYFRYFLSRRPITKKYLEGLADSVLATFPGASPPTAKNSRQPSPKQRTGGDLRR